jgi:uncharacterized protein DUF4397
MAARRRTQAINSCPITFLRVSVAMTRLRLFVCCVAALGLGCKKDATFTQPLPNYAQVTWLNAIPDTGQLDFRVVDIITNGSFMDADFRTSQPFPLALEPGSRRIKVFNSSTVDSIAKKVVLDTTLTFTDGQPYFLYFYGRARTGAKQATLTNVAPPTPPAGQIAIRFLNVANSFAGAPRVIPDTNAPADIFVLGRNVKPSGAPAVAGLAYGALSPYVFVDTAAQLHISLTSPGATDPVISQALLPPGEVASPGTPAIAGSRISGSVLTAVIVARADSPSAAPQGRPTSQRTDTSVSEAATRMTLSGDTVTAQVGSVRVLVNRRGGASCPTTCPSRPDSTLRRTGTAATAPISRGQVILVSGATQPEYNGWQEVLGVDTTLICSPSDTLDVLTGANRRCRGPADTTVASADTALTIFKFRYRIVGTPVSPGTGNPVYRIYPAGYTAVDFRTPQILFIVDKRP